MAFVECEESLNTVTGDPVIFSATFPHSSPGSARPPIVQRCDACSSNVAKALIEGRADAVGQNIGIKYQDIYVTHSFCLSVSLSALSLYSCWIK